MRLVDSKIPYLLTQTPHVFSCSYVHYLISPWPSPRLIFTGGAVITFYCSLTSPSRCGQTCLTSPISHCGLICLSGLTGWFGVHAVTHVRVGGVSTGTWLYVWRGTRYDRPIIVTSFLRDFQTVFCTHPYRSIISASFSMHSHIAATILEDNCLWKVVSH